MATKYAPLALYAVIVGLIIASLVISIAVGAGVTLIILLATLAVVIGALIILQVKLTKVRRSVAKRYSVWLKTQKGYGWREKRKGQIKTRRL